MRHWKFNLTILLIGWPSMIAGYLWAAIKSGFQTGEFQYEKIEDAGMKDFELSKKKEPS